MGNPAIRAKQGVRAILVISAAWVGPVLGAPPVQGDGAAMQQLLAVGD